MKRLYGMLSLLLLFCSITSLSAQPSPVFIDLPAISLARATQVIEAADLRLMMGLGYHQAELEPRLLAGRSGLLASRVYVREINRVELAIVASLEGGYQLVLIGDAAEDMTRLERGLQDLCRQVERAPVSVELGYHTLRLGHIEADRAMGLLKALGFATIEFEADGGKSGSPETIFEAVGAEQLELPIVVKVVNAGKTSLMEADPGGTKRSTSRTSTSSSSRSKGVQGSPELGGAHLHGATSDAPEQRLMVIYDKGEPASLQQLVNLLQTHVDVPAQQIVIEALVVEINADYLRDLGVEFSSSQDNVSGSFERSEGGVNLPFTMIFSRNSFADFVDFKGKLEALTESGNAEILSSPSVLVLNDRQARIQVGQQIPVVRSTTTVSTTTSSVEYFPIGIVLNLKPRINTEGTEVAMQIQTIISSISESTSLSGGLGSSQVAFAPVVDNRQVETYVRVADGTPFIIGGLLSTEKRVDKVGLPFFGNLPFVGRLFSRERIQRDQREVIVVITPHIVPLEEHSFSYLVPKDAQLFDRFDTRLFRNAYRVRDNDVWDLKFIRQSQVLQRLTQRVAHRLEDDVLLQRHPALKRLVAGGIPGEEILVRCMLSDIVEKKLDFGGEVDPEKIFLFAAGDSAASGADFIDLSLNQVVAPALAKERLAVLLSFDARPEADPARPFTYPVASLGDTVVPAGEREFATFLRRLNPTDDQGRPLRWTIVLANQEDVDRLAQILVLKRLIELNTKMPQTLQAFRPGVQILFPTREDMASRYHLIDAEVAQLFYETAPNQYYPAFERRFNSGVGQIEAILRKE